MVRFALLSGRSDDATIRPATPAYKRVRDGGRDCVKSSVVRYLKYPTSLTLCRSFFPERLASPMANVEYGENTTVVGPGLSGKTTFSRRIEVRRLVWAVETSCLA